MNFKSAFMKPFTDMKKLIIGIVLSIVPIINFFALGFILKASGVKEKKVTNQMPEWTDWGDLFVKGLLAMIIGLVYMIPVLIIFMIGLGTAIFSLVGSLGGFPGADAGTDAELMTALINQDWAAVAPALVGAAPLILVAILLGVIISYISPSAVLHYIQSNKMGDAFNFGSVFKKAFTTNYFTAWIIAIIVSMVVSGILSFIPWVGQAIAFFITGVFMYSLIGEAFMSA
ncbi:DUF4013 domain-containing protein [Candidatus Woesearchaeota archaeon]|nr:DUF4013 domain-containing protein [Candidatus Woesearchaeota archaeon]